MWIWGQACHFVYGQNSLAEQMFEEKSDTKTVKWNLQHFSWVFEIIRVASEKPLLDQIPQYTLMVLVN
jgi:hypothetical protein